MKAPRFVILLSSIFTLYVQAQEPIKLAKEFEFGASVGLNYSTIAYGGNIADINFGFNIRSSAEYYFSDSWGIKTSIIYDQKGWSEDLPMSSDVIRANVNYITLPLMANWHFGKRKHWYLHFGPYTGFYLNNKTNFNNEGFDDNIFNQDYGLAYGIGVKIPVADKIRFLIQWDAQAGFRDVFKDINEDTTRNSRGAFNVGLAF